MSDYLVTVSSYWFLSDALLARNALEAAGIESVLDDDTQMTMRHVKLRVRNVDALRAGEVLDSACESLEEVGEADEPRTDADACPACNSAEIVRTPRILQFATIAALLTGLGAATGLGETVFFAILAAGVVLLIADRHRCAECGASWN